jgi:hypothetical protein
MPKARTFDVGREDLLSALQLLGISTRQLEELIRLVTPSGNSSRVVVRGFDKLLAAIRAIDRFAYQARADCHEGQLNLFQEELKPCSSEQSD